MSAIQAINNLFNGLAKTGKGESATTSDISFAGAFSQYAQGQTLKPTTVPQAVSGEAVNFWKDNNDADSELSSITDEHEAEVDELFGRIARLLKSSQ